MYHVFHTIAKYGLLFFTEAMCLWNLYIYANLWKSKTDCWSSTDNCNPFIFNKWFFDILVSIFGRVWCTVNCFCCECSWTSLNIIVLINWQWEEKHNYYIVINSLQVNLENICESEGISWNIEINPSKVKKLKINKYFSFILIDKIIDKKCFVKSHSLSIYEHTSSNFW